MDDVTGIGVLIGAHLGLPCKAECLALLLADAHALHRTAQTVAGFKLGRVHIGFNGKAVVLAGDQAGVLHVVSPQVGRFCAAGAFRHAGQAVPCSAIVVALAIGLGVNHAVRNTGVELAGSLCKQTHGRCHFAVRFRVDHGNRIMEGLAVYAVVSLRAADLFQLVADTRIFHPQVCRRLVVHVFTAAPLFHDAAQKRIQPGASFTQFHCHAITLPASARCAGTPRSRLSPSIFRRKASHTGDCKSAPEHTGQR